MSGMLDSCTQLHTHPISRKETVHVWTSNAISAIQPPHRVPSPHTTSLLPPGAFTAVYLTSSPGPLSERFLAMMSTSTFRSLVYSRPAVVRSEKRSMHSLVIESGTSASFRATGSSSRLTSSISFSPKVLRLGLSRSDSRRRLRLGSES